MLKGNTSRGRNADFRMLNGRSKLLVVRRLRVALPDLRIVVGRWAPAALADEKSDELMADGATHVAAKLLDTRGYLASLLDMPRVAVTDSGVRDAS
jgi:hypothetical protein